MIVTQILLVICMIALPLSGWALIANDITYRQRRKRIPKIGDKDFTKKLDTYLSVSSDQHFWRVLTFRSADDLYEDKKNNV